MYSHPDCIVLGLIGPMKSKPHFANDCIGIIGKIGMLSLSAGCPCFWHASHCLMKKWVSLSSVGHHNIACSIFLFVTWAAMCPSAIHWCASIIKLLCSWSGTHLQRTWSIPFLYSCPAMTVKFWLRSANFLLFSFDQSCGSCISMIKFLVSSYQLSSPSEVRLNNEAFGNSSNTPFSRQSSSNIERKFAMEFSFPGVCYIVKSNSWSNKIHQAIFLTSETLFTIYIWAWWSTCSTNLFPNR